MNRAWHIIFFLFGPSAMASSSTRGPQGGSDWAGARLGRVIIDADPSSRSLGPDGPMNIRTARFETARP